jgi:hypothetical protein
MTVSAASAAGDTSRRPGRASHARTVTVITIAGLTLAGYAVLVAAGAAFARVLQVGGAAGAVTGLMYVLAAVSYPVVGGIVAIRRPGHPIGWALLAIGAGWLLMNASDLLLTFGYVDSPPPSLLAQMALVAWAPLEAVTLALVILLVALFPTGTLQGRTRRAIAWFGGLLVAMDVLACLLRPSLTDGSSGWHRNPVGLASAGPLVRWVVTVVPAVLAFLALAVAVDLVIRWRRSRGIERQQVKWFGYAIVLIVILLVPVMAVPVPHAWLIWFFLALNGLAAAIGLAVIRYRLYDIDRIFSRTLSYAIVTGLLVGVYAGLVLLATRALPVSLSTPVAVAGATLVAAALFNPLRRRVQRMVDRRFNRARYDADQTIASFAARLQDAVELDSVRDDLAGVVQQALEPAHVSVWISQRA